MIRADVLQRFTERFAECGFRGTAFLPSYGLAEATLAHTSDVAGFWELLAAAATGSGT